MQAVGTHEQNATCGVQLNIPLNVMVEKNKISAQVLDEQQQYLGDVQITETSFGHYVLNYIPEKTGLLTMEIYVDDELKHTVNIISSSNKIQLQVQPIDCFVGHEVQILLNKSSNTEIFDVEVIFTHSETGSKEDAVVTNNKQEKSLVVLFTPQKPGSYVSEIIIPGRGPIKGEIVINAKALPKMHIIQGSSKAIVGNTFLLQFTLENASNNDFRNIEVKSPSGDVKNCTLYTSDNGILFFKYIPLEPGTHTVNIQFVGMNATHQIHAEQEEQPNLEDEWFTKPPTNFYSDRGFKNQEPFEQFVPLQPVPITVEDSNVDDFINAEPVL